MDIKDLKDISGIYKINFPNGKIYVGLSVHIKTRIRNHKTKDYKEHPELPISRAIQKYGISDVDILEEIPADNRNLLQEREKYWIQYYDSTNPDIGYNLSKGGDGAQRGSNNSQAKLTETQLFELYDLLEHSILTYEELGAKFNLDRMSIGKINSGERYFHENISYPIRAGRIEKHGLDNKHDAFYGREDELEALIYDLQNTQTPLKELQVKYQIGQSTISLINQGKKYHQSNLTYPLRQKKGAVKRIFSDNELLLIKEKLEDPQWSMSAIGELLHCD